MRLFAPMRAYERLERALADERRERAAAEGERDAWRSSCHRQEQRIDELIANLVGMRRDGFVPAGLGIQDRPSEPAPSPPAQPPLPMVVRAAINQMTSGPTDELRGVLMSYAVEQLETRPTEEEAIALEIVRGGILE